MFLILGTSECKFCLESKKLLNDSGLKYTYLDLSLKFGDGWRCIFNLLKSILGKHKTIPIIFQLDEGDTNAGSDNYGQVPEELTPEELEKRGWSYVGTFFELEELVDDLGISINDDY